MLGFSPDSSSLLFVDWHRDWPEPNRTLALWSPATGRKVNVCTEAGVHCACFTPDSQVLVFGTARHGVPEVVAREIASGGEVFRHRFPFDKWIDDCEISPDGRLLAIASTGLDSKSYLRVLSLMNTMPSQQYVQGASRCRHLSFSPSGDRLAVLGSESLVTIWPGRLSTEPSRGPAPRFLERARFEKLWASLVAAAPVANKALYDLATFGDAAVRRLASHLTTDDHLPTRKPQSQRLFGCWTTLPRAIGPSLMSDFHGFADLQSRRCSRQKDVIHRTRRMRSWSNCCQRPTNRSFRRPAS